MVRLPDLDGTSDLQRYTSGTRPGPHINDYNLESPVRHSPDSITWPTQQSIRLDRSSMASKPSLPPLHLPSLSLSSNPISFVKGGYGHRSTIPTSAAYDHVTAYPSSQPTTPHTSMSTGMSSTRSPMYANTMMTDSSASSTDDRYAGFPLTSMGVRDGRVKKHSPRCPPRRLQARNREMSLSRFASPSLSLDNESSLVHPQFDNRKAGKERNAREDIRSQMEKHYRELLAAGPEYQPVTRLNKHNCDVARIPCKKEEVLDLSFRLHQDRKTDIHELKEALRSIGSKLSRKTSSDDLQEVRAMIQRALGETAYVPTQRIPVSHLYAPNTPDATPSPEHTLSFNSD